MLLGYTGRTRAIRGYGQKPPEVEAQPSDWEAGHLLSTWQARLRWPGYTMGLPLSDKGNSLFIVRAALGSQRT